MENPYEGLSDEDLLGAWADAMRELRRRELIRSHNNPVADIAEALAAKMLNLNLAAPSTSGYDALDDSGIRYQIKARRLTPENKSRQLSPLRDLSGERFDVLLALIFDERLQLQEMWRVPHVVISKYATWSDHVNGHIVRMRGPILVDPEVQRLR